MGLETATYINGLVTTNPTSSDPKSQGDDHLRLVKSTVKATFSNITGAVTPTQADLNVLLGAGTTPTAGGAVYGTGTAYATTAAGTAGQVLTSNGAGAPTWQTSSGSSGLRNRIINGGITIDQRNAGVAQTITAAAALAYTVDRFYAYSTGANVTGQQVAGSLQSQKRYRFTGAASVTAIGFGTRLEAVNTYDLNNKTVTISADIANSLLTTVTWNLYRATTTDDTFGTLAAPTVTSVGTGTFTVTSTVTNYNAQVTLPTAAITGLQLVFTVGAQTSGTWTIGNVQLELGSVATPFEQRPYGMELALCQRYYAAGNHGLSASNSGGLGQTVISPTTIFRTSPTFTTTLGGGFITSTSITTNTIALQLQSLGASVAAAGNSYSWTASAEL